MSASVAPRPAIVATRLGTFGEFAIAGYLVAVVSGVLLAVPYSPSDAYGSLATLLLSNPSGAFCRNLHWWAGEFCFVATLLHAADHLRAGTERRLPAGAWLRLVLALAAIAFIMLSGFLLRGDVDARQALRVVSFATSRIPLAGPDLSSLLFGVQDSLTTVYVQHAATATIAVWLFAIEHSRRLWPRTRTLMAVLAGLVAVSLILSPGLHAGPDTVVKGPWFFLGLQEMLHWTSQPLLVIAATLAVLAALYAVRVADVRSARQLKGVLAGIVVAYGVLCAVGGFMRGENWSWKAHWPDGSGNLHPGWVFASVDVPVPLPIPTAMGQPEGCLVCHRDVTGLGNAHRADAVGCASCHGGDRLTLDKQRAHDGMRRIPGNLADAAQSCGQSSCHQPVVERVNNSLMNTMAGVIAVDRSVFGEPTGVMPTSVPRADRLSHSAADSHLRQLCASCHLSATKTAFGPNTEESRGGGCNACHLSYDPATLQALADYQEAKNTGDAPPPTRHPLIGLDIGNGQCLGCHSRSGRISTNYDGWHELDDPSPAVRLAARPASGKPGTYRLFGDGRIFERAAADVHAQAGMDCIDCHTATEVMGDGTAPAYKREALRVTCEDCHATGGEPLPTVANELLDPDSQRLIALRGWRPGPDELRVRARSGGVLVNAVVDRAGAAWLIRKRTGARLPLDPVAPACIEGGGHSRLSCGSCHTAWAPRCSNCHTSFDPDAGAFDTVADTPVTGAWVERGGPFLADAPTLGVRVDADAAAGTGRIDTFAPGMIMALDRPRQGGPPDVVHTRLYARVEPHTTQRQPRSCVSCHSDPEALGYGSGTLTLRHDGPGRGRWVFTPATAAAPADGLPADAWIAFLGTRGDRVSTRDDVRPFDVGEQQRILTVGACLTCHAPDSGPMRHAVRNWPDVLAARTSACIVPTW